MTHDTARVAHASRTGCDMTCDKAKVGMWAQSETGHVVTCVMGRGWHMGAGRAVA